MKKYKLRCLIFLSLFSPLLLLATQKIVVTGVVLAPNKEPVANVNIFIEKTETGTITNAQGWFSLEIPVQKTILNISHVAFVSQTIEISQKESEQALQEGTFFVKIILEPQIQTLKVVEVVDGKIQIAYNDAKKWILDYVLIGEDEILLLLLYKNKKYLQLINHLHETIAVTSVDYKYRHLYKGCSGDTYLISNNDACQIFLMDDQFYLVYHVAKEKFINTIEKIMVVTSHAVYLKETSLQNQKIDYYKIDTINKSTTLLYTIFNQLVSELQRERYELYEELITTGEGTDMSLNVSASSMREDPKSDNRKAQAIRMSFAYNEYILSQEPYNPLFEINNELCLFNHIDGELVKFSLEGEQTDKIKINYHIDNEWNKKIIVNEEKTRCFLIFSHSGKTVLKELNIDTGTIIQEYKIERHIYPEKISVRKDKIYYLAKDIYQNEDKSHIWMQYLD